MFDCKKIKVNRDLYYKLLYLANPCDTKTWLGELKFIKDYIYTAPILLNISNLKDQYIIKKQSINKNSIMEKNIYKIISNDLLKEKSPLLFPFLYLDYICENEQVLVIESYDFSFKKAILENYANSINWWIKVLYQLTKAVYYLEERGINHNNISIENIMFQYITKNSDDIAIILTDFSNATNDSNFELGKDLNYFFKNLLNNEYFPKKLAKELYPFVKLETHNYYKSGKFLSRLFTNMYPFVSSYNINKIFAVGIGSIIGDSIGMPVKQAGKIHEKITEMYPSNKFRGYYSQLSLPSMSITETTQISMAIIESIIINGGEIICSSIAQQLKKWYIENPFFSKSFEHFKGINNSGNNWNQNVLLKDSNKADNGVVSRCWIISILYINDHYQNVIDYTIKQASVTETNKDSIYTAVFVALLIHFLINNDNKKLLDEIIDDCIDLVKLNLSTEMIEILQTSHLKKYIELNGGAGWVGHTMQVVLWSIRNTNSFKDAVISSVNVPGDTTNNTSITGSIAGAIYGYSELNWNINNIEFYKDKILTMIKC